MACTEATGLVSVAWGTRTTSKTGRERRPTMRTMRRIRNVAFLGLLVTFVWAGPVSVRAEDGGYYCGYGDCTLQYLNCQGVWTDYYYPALGLNNPQECILAYDKALLPPPGDTCYVFLNDEGSYHWASEDPIACPELGGSNTVCFVCLMNDR
jgi:hypothetical protein